MSQFNRENWGGQVESGENRSPIVCADLVYSALRIARVLTSAGRSPSPEQVNDALAALNAMLQSWAIDPLLVQSILRIEFPLSSGKADYILGRDGADVDCDVPQRMVAFGRIAPGGSERVEAILDMARWRNGSSGGYYRATATAGTLSIRPTPAGDEIGVIYVWAPFSEFLTVDDSVVLPRGYRRAIEYNLAVEITARFPNATMSAEASRIAMESKMEIMAFNEEPGELRCDSALLRPRYFDMLTGRYS